MKHSNSINNPFWKNPRIITIVLFSILGIAIGVCGFLKKDDITFVDALYDTFQLFLMHHTFEETPNLLIDISRWMIFIVIILLSIEIILLIIPEQLKLLKIRLFYRDHIIICGLTEKSLEIADRYFNKKKIFIDNNPANPLHRSLRNSNTKLLIGNPGSKAIWELAEIYRAKVVFVFTGDDKTNVEIAQVISSLLENTNRKDALRCFLPIADRELKTILEETTLFKYKTKNFDAILFNINKMGIKYSICMNIDKILPANMKTSPEILIVGLTEKTENVIINLAHCLTMQRKTFCFTVVEEDEIKINSFKRKYHYLKDFAEIEISNHSLEKICAEKIFDSIFICTENQIDAAKQAIEIHYFFGKNAPNILLFCNDVDAFNIMLKKELEKKKIFPVNLFGQLADYVFELDRNIESKAKEAHYFWNDIYKMNTEWDTLSEHFKQSSRNQILDNYLKIYITRGKKFEDFKNCLVSFSDNEKETLAMMEHRRWVIEKFENGWVLGERENEFKRHDCLVSWNILSKQQQAKDYDTIDLMIKLLNNQSI